MTVVAGSRHGLVEDDVDEEKKQGRRVKRRLQGGRGREVKAEVMETERRRLGQTAESRRDIRAKK